MAAIRKYLLLEYLMASETLERLRAEISTLSEADRAELAHELIVSLDEPHDNEAGVAWDREIVRRIAEIDAGQATFLDRAEFRRRMRASLATQ
jgi:putative addiction module component (TIGR02574 family)